MYCIAIGRVTRYSFSPLLFEDHTYEQTIVILE